MGRKHIYKGYNDVYNSVFHQIQSLMSRAEYLKKHIKVSMHSCKYLQLREKNELSLPADTQYTIYVCVCVLILQMQETQRDVSLDRDSLADSIRSCESPVMCNHSFVAVLKYMQC